MSSAHALTTSCPARRVGRRAMTNLTITVTSTLRATQSPTKSNSTRSTLLKVNKVDRIGNKFERIRQQSTLLPICCRFRQQSTFNKVDRVEFNFVDSVYCVYRA